MVWIAFALMTAAAVLCLVWPLAGGRAGDTGPVPDVAFYKSQLAEVDDDVGRGLVAAGDADLTRAEIARRLLRSAGGARRPPTLLGKGFRRRRIAAALAAAVLVPSLTLGLYLKVGHPAWPDQPIATREATPGFDLAAAIPKIEAHLAEHPDDGRGFELLAPIYLRLGRFDDAARAYASALRLLGETPERRAALGQARVMAADGVVTAQARADFDEALAKNPDLPQARFFVALATEQDGDKPKALDLWQKLAAMSPPEAPWLPAVRQHLAALGVPMAPEPPEAAVLPATGPESAAGAGIAALPPEQRLGAIRGMVDGLAARLAQNGRDPDGWLRLVKAYTVLGEQGKARTALADARKVLDGDADALARLDGLARQLGLEG